MDPFNYGNKTKETIAKGDEITLTKGTITESFTVLSNSNEKITAIPKYNITLTENYPVQSSTAETIEFSTRPYWSRDEIDKETPGWNSGAVNNVVDINMDNEANKIQKYIIAYKTSLEDMGVEGVEVRAAKYSDLSVTGITNDMRNPGKTGIFWLGSCSSANYSCPILLDNTGNFINNYYYGNSSGVRPIIIIDK